MLNKDTFDEATVGDVISVVDDMAYDYETHILRVDSVEHDAEFANDDNTQGKRCYCTDLEEQFYGEDYITVIHEGNYIEHLNEECKLSDSDIVCIWKGLEDIPMNPETECLEQPYFIFPEGLNRMKIWKWFDKHYSKGVRALLHGDYREG